MVFSSFSFILLFLPLVVVVFMLLESKGMVRLSSWWLIFASLFFYGWWNYRYLLLPIGSVVFNFWMGRRLLADTKSGRWLLVFGLAANLLLLGWYKYAGFFAINLAAVTGLPIPVPNIALPLAISFCTFQQVSFLVDCHRKQVAPFNFRKYLLYIVFFPHLIAGPVVRHHELMPQLETRRTMRQRWDDIAFGLQLFAFGLFKKVFIADRIAVYADPVFLSAAQGTTPTLLEAWAGSLAYMFQLYFDFSGYADMALGGARMLGVTLPQNFDSPYKARSLADFWRRWHITLSHFLRDYLYFPLGGSRRGQVRTWVNLFVTMLLGGLWHGAAWTYVLWGGLHGFGLAVCHAWRDWAGKRGLHMPGMLARGMTLSFVLICWVIFRASSWDAAKHIFGGMSGQGGLELPREMRWLGNLTGWTVVQTRNLGALADSHVFWICPLLLVLCLVAPNTRELFEERGWGEPERLNAVRAVALAAVLTVCLVNMLAHNEVFIYYVF